jgi:hypothetical protein
MLRGPRWRRDVPEVLAEQVRDRNFRLFAELPGVALVVVPSEITEATGQVIEVIG